MTMNNDDNFNAGPDAVVIDESPTPVAPPRPVVSRGVVSAKDALELSMYVFGDLPTAEAWMQAGHASLGGGSPEWACQQPGGLDQVLRLLCAIANGTEP